MNLYTSYRMLQQAGMERTHGLFVDLSESLGGPRAHGLQKPILVRTILDLDAHNPTDALWSFRAVYPEQRQAAERIARLVALVAYDSAATRFGKKNGLLENARKVSADYLAGIASGGSLDRIRKQVWRTSVGIKPPFVNMFYLAWITCATPDRMRTLAGSILDASRYAVPEEARRCDAERMIVDTVRAVRTELSNRLAFDPHDYIAGPGEILSPVAIASIEKEARRRTPVGVVNGKLQLSINEAFSIGV